MQIKVDVQLTKLDGTPMTTVENYDNENFVSTEETPKENPYYQKKVSVTLQSVCVNTLLATTQKDANISGTEKLKRFNLASKIQANDSVDLTAEEITLVKKRIGEISVPLVIGKAYELLEQKNTED